MQIVFYYSCTSGGIFKILITCVPTSKYNLHGPSDTDVVVLHQDVKGVGRIKKKRYADSDEQPRDEKFF